MDLGAVLKLAPCSKIYGGLVMLKILIADDHAIVREGLKQIIAENDRMVIAAEADNGKDVLKKAQNCDIDVLVLDISMPGRDGIEVIKQLKIDKPKLPILVLSMHSEEQYALRVIKAGAAGYLTKESAPDELIGAIEKVGAGRKYISDKLAEILALELETGIKKAIHETLSDREYQVMYMIATGKTVKQIANELSLSDKTISTYRSRILSKLNMKNNAEVTYYAIKKGIVA